LDSGDSSRSTTATHSRTSSEGVTPPYAVVNQGNSFMIFLSVWGTKFLLKGKKVVDSIVNQKITSHGVYGRMNK